MTEEQIKHELNSIGIFITKDQAAKLLFKCHLQGQIDLLRYIFHATRHYGRQIIATTIDDKITELQSQLNKL